MLSYEAVTFDRGESWKAVVKELVQRPDFNSKGAALAFAGSVFRGERKPEVDNRLKDLHGPSLSS